MKWEAFLVFLVLFLFVTGVGFYAARWRKGDLALLEEWGLGGRRFGTIVTWFLLGGDLYTAYTFIAVPALVYGVGAFGFFAVPYTIIVFPIMYVVMPRLWRVCKARSLITPADFVRERFDSRSMSLAVAVTGIVATMPYIALQLVGIQAVLIALGIKGSGLAKDLPLFVAFAILAAYTYTSGLRAPALTAIVKDFLVYLTVIVAVIVIPAKLGGFGHIFSVAATHFEGTKASIILSPGLFGAFSTLALGSAFALLLYPHVITGTLGAKSARTIERNATILPLYSIALALIALLGYMAIAAGIHTKVTSLVVPLLFIKTLPEWFVGVAFAAIAIGALVPAAIMSIAAANLFSRNIYREFFNPTATTQQEARVAKLVSLAVKLGAVLFVVIVPLKYSIYLQTLGGIWILQTGPAIIGGLWTRWFHKRALLLGWIVGISWGTYMAVSLQFKSSIYVLHILGKVVPGYAAVFAVIANLAIVVVFSAIFNAAKVSAGVDATSPSDYLPEVRQHVPLVND